MSPADGSPRSFGILSSYPPTPCGIATFSAALSAGLIANGVSVNVVRCGEVPPMEDALVVASLDCGTSVAADALQRNDVVVVQHEYGIYGGPNGQDVLDVLGRVRGAPIIVVAHTVLDRPTVHQRAVLEQVCHAADAVVVMTESARLRLVRSYAVDVETILVIPHGAASPTVEPHESVTAAGGTRGPRVLTWGLLGPGKGIEWAIDAMATLTDMDPRPQYVIAGATHPKVLAYAGEAYREMLVDRARRSHASPFIEFDDAYRDLHSLAELIESADVVVLPYDSEDQVTSGVLVDAVAAGRPVISTAFPHAVELLASGAGIVVPQRDPIALASAIRAVLSDPTLASDMAAEARRLAPDLSWNAVARQYDDLAARLLGARAAVRT